MTPASDTVQLRERIDAALAARDRATAVGAALDAVRDGLEIACLYAEVLVPLMIDMGAQWQAGRTAVWEEHFASATVRTIVESLYPEVQSAAPADRSRGTAVLACPPQEQHDLGLRMLSDRMELAGWRVVFLGADTPADEIVAAAEAALADTVVLTGSTHYHRTMLRALVEDLDARLGSARVLVGGPAFDAACDEWCDGHLIDVGELTGGDAGC